MNRPLEKSLIITILRKCERMNNTAPAPRAAAKLGARFDPKWVIILAIVAFMLIFQVFPLLYLALKPSSQREAFP